MHMVSSRVTSQPRFSIKYESRQLRGTEEREKEIYNHIETKKTKKKSIYIIIKNTIS